MSRSPMKHPDTAWLDRLRAGLLDHRPAFKAELEAHLRHCPRCAQRGQWDPLSARLLGDAERQHIQARLLQARRRSAEPAGRRQRPRWLPLAAAAVLVTAFTALVQQEQPREPASAQLARTETADTPDLYENLDFYLWLADHKTDTGQAPLNADQHS